MAYLVEWIMDPPEHEWEHDMTTNTIVATTTTVVRTYFHLGRVHEGAALDVSPVGPLAPRDFPGALLGQPLGRWDFPPKPLPDFSMEPMSPGLPSAGPQPAVSVIELSSKTTFRAATALLPLLEYHWVSTHLLKRIHQKSDLQKLAAPHMRPGLAAVLSVLR